LHEFIKPEYFLLFGRLCSRFT